MKLTEQETLKITELAKIQIQPQEIPKYQFQLEQIFKMITRLQEVEIDTNVEIYNFSGLQLTLRADEALSKENAEIVTSNAPKREFNCFVVPKVKE